MRAVSVVHRCADMLSTATINQPVACRTFCAPNYLWNALFTLSNPRGIHFVSHDLQGDASRQGSRRKGHIKSSRRHDPVNQRHDRQAHRGDTSGRRYFPPRCRRHYRAGPVLRAATGRRRDGCTRGGTQVCWQPCCVQLQAQQADTAQCCRMAKMPEICRSPSYF